MSLTSTTRPSNDLSVLIRATLVTESRVPETHKKNTKPIFYETDLVRCNENVYTDSEFPLMNGTPGVVTKRFVSFENHPQKIDRMDAPKLELNYAITCHKAQGSEADHVVFVLEKRISPLLHKRNLLYTAMTRAKKTLTIIGPMDVLHYMVATDPVKRLTTMHEHF